jgi:hypothetical protein
MLGAIATDLPPEAMLRRRVRAASRRCRSRGCGRERALVELRADALALRAPEVAAVLRARARPPAAIAWRRCCG